MVSYYQNHQKRRFSNFNRFAKFLLIGNNIDGKVNVDVVKFNDFEEVKIMLPRIFENLYCEGEWEMHLYQVPEKWSIRNKYGYYKIPSKGKMVFEFSYMNAGERNQIFITNTIIHIATLTKYFDQYWKENNGDPYHFKISEEYITVELIEPIDGRDLKNSEFRRELMET
jgi:hypothetical protein